MRVLPSPLLHILTLKQARALDVQAATRFKVSTRLLMENAGVGCAEIAHDMWRRRSTRTASGKTGTVLIFCGSGGNGGDGYVVARHLTLAGVPVAVKAVGQPRPGTDAADARASWRALRAPAPRRKGPPTLVIDAVLGTGVARPVAGAALRAIKQINELASNGARVLSLDLPSGIETDSGEPLGIAVRATVTATIAATKRGLTREHSRHYRGRVVVIPFGAPAQLRG